MAVGYLASGETVLWEHYRGLGSDREFAHQSIMRLYTAEHPSGTVDVHKDWQRRQCVLWPQDTKSDLAAWAVVNDEILDADRQLAHLTRLRLIKGEPSFLGTKRERLDISGVKGVTEAQKTTLRALGAIE